MTEKKEVVLNIGFGLENVECIAYVLISEKKWNHVKKYLEMYPNEMRVHAYSNPSPMELMGDEFNGTKLLKQINVISDRKKVDAFKILHGKSLANDDNILEKMLDKYKKLHHAHKMEKLFATKKEVILYFGNLKYQDPYVFISGKIWNKLKEYLQNSKTHTIYSEPPYKWYNKYNGEKLLRMLHVIYKEQEIEAFKKIHPIRYEGDKTNIPLKVIGVLIERYII
jgi:hypothetical protein